MTEVKWTKDAVEDFKQISIEAQKAIVEKIEKLEEKGTGIEEVGKASRKDMGLELWRLKAKKNDKVDHRAIFDILDGEIYLIAIGTRDRIYDTESWKEIKEKIREL